MHGVQVVCGVPGECVVLDVCMWCLRRVCVVLKVFGAQGVCVVFEESVEFEV